MKKLIILWLIKKWLPDYHLTKKRKGKLVVEEKEVINARLERVC